MHRKAFALSGHGKAPVATIIIAALVIMPALVLVSTMRSGIIVASPGDNFGYDTIGIVGTASLESYMRGSVFTCPSAGTATSITVYIFDEYEAGKQCAIYKHSDSTLLTNGTTVTLDNLVDPADWLTFTFSTPPTLAENTKYVLVCRTTDMVNIYYDVEETEDQGHYEDGGLSSFPENASFTHEPRVYSIYCTYEYEPPAAPPTKPTLVSPENASMISDNTPTFFWENGENAENHRLIIDNDFGYGSPEENTVIISDNFYTITTELPNDNYYWQIIAVSGSGENASDNWIFQVSVLSGWFTPTVENACGESVGYEAIKSVDENFSSYWWHDTVENHWIEYDLGMTREITKIRIYQIAGHIFGATSGVVVYISDNTENWGDNVWEGLLNVTPWATAGTFDENGRYVRLVSKDNSYNQWIIEFQAYMGKFINSLALYLPENDWIIGDNTPYFEWALGGDIFVENYRLLVDNDSDFSSPIENQFFDNTENAYTAISEYPWDNYYWKVVASRDNEGMENSSAVWQFELIFINPTFSTDGATNVGSDNATFNATIAFGSYDNIDIRFKFKSDVQNYLEGENENWSLSDWYYDSPTPIDIVGDWGNRTPVNYVAASNSSQEAKDNANYVADGSSDQVEIQLAIDNLNSYGGGTIYLFAGTYYFGNIKFTFRHNISIVGEDRENVIIQYVDDSSRFTQGPYPYVVYAENLLFENFTVNGPGRLIPGETNAIMVHNLGHAVFRNLRVENTTAEGIYLEQGTNMKMFDIWVIDCIIKNVGESGIMPTGGQGPSDNTHEIYILNNTLVGVGLGSPGYPGGGLSIAIYDADDVVIANNIIENGGAGGIRVVGLEGFPSENVLIQGNYLRRNNLMNAENAGGIMFTPPDYQNNITIIGNDIDHFKGIRLMNDNAENFVIDNNSFYNTVFAIPENQGVGIVIENNVDSHFDSENNWTPWYTVIKTVDYGTQSYSEVVENLYPISIHAYQGWIKYNTTEVENTTEDWRIFTTSGIEPPVLYYPENDGTTTSSPVFEWTNGAGASYHRLLVDNDNDFSSTIINVNIATPDNTFTSSLSTDNYWWNVTAVYGVDENSSDDWTFELLLAPPFEGAGTVENRYLIFNVALLQQVGNYKAFHFALKNDIDASETMSWNGGTGFAPIGDNDDKFVGSLDGRGFIISDLYIGRDNDNFIGIFGSIGNSSLLENIGIENENITGRNYVGGLVGYNEGIISQNYSAGSVVGDNYVGGLVGFNTENTINTYSSSSVTGNFDVGGLVGHNDGLVSNSYSVGPVFGNYNVGGIVGYEIAYAWAWYDVETWTNHINVTGTGWYEVETWTNYMDATGTGWYEVETWTNYVYAGPMWQTVETWTNYIDAPTETVFYSMDDDGYITNQAASYVAVHDNNVGYALSNSSDRLYIGQVFILEYEIKRSYVYFDTSGIPDTATIQSATLSLYGRSDSSTDDFDIVIQSGQPTYPRDPLVLGDYYYVYYGYSDGGSFNTSDFTTSGYNVITLNENALTWINKTGTTKLALRSDNEIYSITPTQYEYVSVYSYEKGAGYQPKLTVSYTTGTVSNSFYDNQTSGQSDTGKGTGLSTAQMQQISTFLDNGWDIVLRENYVDEIWYIDNGTDYPRLGWEAVTLAWYEVETWTNRMNSSPVGWYEVETWTNYVHVLNWYDVETWTNYMLRSTWYEVETWTNYMNASVIGWYEVETWTNYPDTIPPVWGEVETWTNYLNMFLPGWYEVETWTNYLNAFPPGWYEVETWTNNIDASEEEIPVPPAEQPSVWVTIIRILGIVGFLGWAGWRFKLVDDPATGIEAGLTVVVAIIGIVIIWFVAEAIGAAAAAL